MRLDLEMKSTNTEDCWGQDSVFWSSHSLRERCPKMLIFGHIHPKLATYVIILHSYTRLTENKTTSPPDGSVYYSYLSIDLDSMLLEDYNLLCLA